MGLTALREKKTYTGETKLNPTARDDTLKSTQNGPNYRLQTFSGGNKGSLFGSSVILR